MNEFSLELQRITKAFGVKTVLDRVSLKVAEGSIVGLLGKNGAGKSTLIKCALGLLKPQSGSAFVFGQDAWTLDAANKANIGYVAQTPGLYPWMRVRQIINYVASFYDHWNDGLVDGLLTDWELDPSARIAQLSAGQAQKLAIVLSLGHEPRLLVLDEPAAALDPEARRAFLDTLLRLVGVGRTILFSTHITSDLERVAERVVILHRGQILVDEDLGALKDRVKRLHITADQQLPAEFAIPGALRQKRAGAEAKVSVADASPELISAVERRWSANVDIEDLNLEDIFLEMTHA